MKIKIKKRLPEVIKINDFKDYEELESFIIENEHKLFKCSSMPICKLIGYDKQGYFVLEPVQVNGETGWIIDERLDSSTIIIFKSETGWYADKISPYEN